MTSDTSPPDPSITRLWDDSVQAFRYCGHSPSPEALRTQVPVADPSDVIPEGEWQEFNVWPKEVPILNQGNRGACNGHAAASSLMLARSVANMSFVKLSPWMIYARLCGGWDRGSNILDALKMLQTEGTCPFDDFKYSDINPRDITPQNEADGKRFRIEVGKSLTTWAQIMSAVQRLRPLNVSIKVGGGFNNLDAEGVPTPGRGMANHAVCWGMGAKKSAKWGWLILMANSWDVSWGQAGFCWMSEQHIQVGGFEAYSVSAAVDDPKDPTNPF